MSYGYIGSMRAQPGVRDQVIAIMLESAQGLAIAGCQQYTIAAATDDDVTVWVCEVWDTKEQHDASLQLPQVRETIAKAQPLIAGGFTRVETDVRGGLGL
jgi:quinol monooxygenase YgiN